MDRLIYEDVDKGTQLRLTVSEFREVVYLHIRKYYLDFEGEFRPSNEGVSMPLNLSSTLSLFLAISELLSDTEIDMAIGNEEILNLWRELNVEQHGVGDSTSPRQ